MSKVILQGYIVVPKNEIPIVLKELPLHINLTRQEDGCLVFRVERCEKDDKKFEVYEEFSSRDAFQLHQERVKSSRWGKITENVERHYKITQMD